MSIDCLILELKEEHGNSVIRDHEIVSKPSLSVKTMPCILTVIIITLLY